MGSMATSGLLRMPRRVLGFLEQHRCNKPRGADEPELGTSFIIKEGVESAMQMGNEPPTYDVLGRPSDECCTVLRCKAGLVRDQYPSRRRGGSGLYSIAFGPKDPNLKAIVMDSGEVLEVAREFAREHGVEDQMEFVAGDMFLDPLPEVDAVLLSNVLHDWDIPECVDLLKRSKGASKRMGKSGSTMSSWMTNWMASLPLALYSASLFTLTEGRVYSRG